MRVDAFGFYRALIFVICAEKCRKYSNFRAEKCEFSLFFRAYLCKFAAYFTD